MLKINELLKKVKSNLEEGLKKRILKREIHKMKIQTVKVKKSLSLRLVMIKWKNIIDLHLYKDGMVLITSYKYFLKNMKKWVQCLKYIGNQSQKTWMQLFLCSLEKWNTLPSKMTLLFCMRCSKRNWKNIHHF